MFKKLVAYIAVSFLYFSQILSSVALASNLPITVDGTTNTQIDAAANGVPIVQIAAPNSGGLSHNKFTDYNVNSQGLIINNATGNTDGIIKTQIGGLINDNPNLSRSASVILNEVTSNNITQINGYTEIAGGRADLVIANPNGISMSGAGFINVSRLTAVVGSVNEFNPHPDELTFSLANVTDGFLPKLTISGTGLSLDQFISDEITLEGVTSTDLVASLMNIVAPIYAGEGEVSLRSGDDNFNYLTKTVTSTSENIGTNAPEEIAIDASNLAKIQASKIYIIATKEGFGIKYSADLLASRAGITIDSKGNIEYANMESEIGDIKIKAKNNIIQNGISETKSTTAILDIFANGNITNNGQFLSAGNIEIKTDSSFFNESEELNLSGGDFVIEAVDFVNEGVISATGNLNVIATSSLTNSKDLIAGIDLSLTANQLTNKLSLAANNDIIINANILENSVENSSIKALNNIELNIVNLDNSNGVITASNNLDLRNIALNSPDSAELLSISSQAVEISNAGGSFLAGNSLDFNLGDSDYEITGALESLGTININAKNITNKADISANSSITITAVDWFSNGLLNDENNVNIKLTAGTNLNITSENLLSNYAIISAGENLTLTSNSGNINNNASAEIIGGTGSTTLSALNGTVNQNSLNSLVSNGDLTLDVEDFLNTGRVDIAGDFTLNVSKDLTNAANALIYSGGDMTLNVFNNLTNNSGAVIFAENNLIIQKRGLDHPDYDVNNNQINKLSNISAEITSYGGAMTIKAKTFNNERSEMRSQLFVEGTYYCGQYVNGCWSYYDDVYSVSSEAIADKSVIFAQGDLIIDAVDLTNNSSNILTNGDLDLNVSGIFTNTAPEFRVGIYTRRTNDNGGQPSIDKTTISKPYSTSIKSAQNIVGTASDEINNTTVKKLGGVESVEKESSDLTDPNSPINSGLVEIDLASYFEGPDNQGLFTKSDDPNAPLFETRSQFIDQSKFFGSDYFYEKIGLNLDDVQTEFEQQNKRLVGDQFFQTKIIAEELRTISKNSMLLSENENNVNNEIESMLDNAADEYARLGLTADTPLTPAQIDALEKDIVWFETKTIDGGIYVVPKIYLSKATRNRIKNNDSLADTANIYASGNIDLTSQNGSIINSGSIIATNITLTAQSDVTNKNFSNITAAEDLNITATTGSITNLSKLSANGDLSLTAAKDIISSSTILTNDPDALASGNIAYISNGSEAMAVGGRSIRSATLETASITAENLTINAGGSFKNQAADIKASENITVTAGDDIEIGALELRNGGKSLSWGKMVVSDVTEKIGNNIVTGSLDLTSQNGSILNNGSIIAKNNVTLKAKGDVTNEIFSNITTDEALFISAAEGFITNLGELNSKGDLSLTAAKDIINSSTISTNNQDYLDSNNIAYISNGSEAATTGNRSIRSSLLGTAKITAQNLTINAGGSFKNQAADITATENITITAGDDIEIGALALRNRSVTHWGNHKKGGTVITDTTKNIGSNITAGGSVVLDATGLGADTDGEKALALQNQNNLEILALQNQINEKNSQIESNSNSGKGRSRENAAIAREVKALEGQMTQVERVFSTNIASLENTIGSNVNINGSAITAGGDVTISANDEVNIAAVQDSSYYKSTFQKTGGTTRKSAITVNSDVTNIHSNISADGDLEITSGSDLNLIGVNLAADSATINAGDELNVFSVEDSSYSYSTSSKSRNYSSITRVLLPGFAAIYGVIGNSGIPIFSSVGTTVDAILEGDYNSKSNLNERNNIINQASNIMIDDSLTLAANYDLNIAGSDLSGSSGNLSSTEGSVNIYNVKDVDYSRSESNSSKTTFASFVVGAHQLITTAVASGVTSLNPTQTPKERLDKIRENDNSASGLPQKTEQHIKIVNDETIVASNLSFGSLAINSGADVNITSSNLTTNEGDLDIISANNTNIKTDVENDYSYSFDKKSSPSIMAAISNGIVNIFDAAMPSFGGDKKDTTESNDDVSEMVYDKNSTKIDISSTTNVASVLTSANDLDISSQNDILISGSDLNAGNNINLTSIDGETVIASIVNESSESIETIRQDYNRAYLGYNRGRLSANSESSINELKRDENISTQVSSNINAGNNLNINAQENIDILSSKVAAGGAVNLTSEEGNVNILANKNTSSVKTETRDGSLTLSAGIGHVAVDAVYAEYDLVKAISGFADAKKELNHTETLYKNGEATKDAVKDAEINLAMAGLNVTLAELKLAAVAAKAAESSAALGFYADLQLIREGQKTNSSSYDSLEVASEILAGENINITSGASLLGISPALLTKDQGNTNIKGSIASVIGDINVTSAKDTNISAVETNSTFSSMTESYSQTVTLGSSAPAATSTFEKLIEQLSASMGIGTSRSKSDSSSKSYSNTTLTAANGDVKINSLNDTNIEGADIFAENITLNTVNDLNIESLQNFAHSKSRSSSFNLGGGGGSISVGFGVSSGNFDRNWVDDQTSVIATNSVTINTGNNANIKGAIIANITNAQKGDVIGNSKLKQKDWIDGGNLALNTGTLTFENIQDREENNASSFGLSTTIGTGISSSSSTGGNPNQSLNFFPSGSSTISMTDSGYIKEQTTKATIGAGTIKTNSAITFDINGNPVTITGGDLLTAESSELAGLNRNINESQIITRNTITGALDVSATIDNRLFVAGYESFTDQKELIQEDVTLSDKEKRTQIAALQGNILLKELGSLPRNLGASNQLFFETAELITDPIKKIPLLGDIFYHLSPIEQLAHTFVEKDSKLYFTNINTGEATEVDRADLTRNYALNGIQTDLNKLVENYLDNNPELTVRYNPTHGMIGDLIESGAGKLTTALHVPEVVAMNRYVKNDLYERRNLTSEIDSVTGDVHRPINLFHSQGTIIGVGAMQLYASEYGNDGWENNYNAINNMQKFVAVGPAVLKEDWKKSVKGLGLQFDAEQDYRHDPSDPIRYLTAPSNIIDQTVNLIKPDFRSPVYLPNLTDIPRGIYHGILHIESHDVTNPYYQQPLK